MLMSPQDLTGFGLCCCPRAPYNLHCCGCCQLEIGYWTKRDLEIPNLASWITNLQDSCLAEIQDSSQPHPA